MLAANGGPADNGSSVRKPQDETTLRQSVIAQRLRVIEKSKDVPYSLLSTKWKGFTHFNGKQLHTLETETFSAQLSI